MGDTFRTLLEEAQADPEHADYQRLRAAWIDGGCHAATFGDDEAQEELRMRMATGAWQEARELAEELVDRDPLDITLRLTYARLLESLDETFEAGDQRTFASGLLRAILRSGDGRSPASALRVIHPREQELTLEILGLRAVRSQVEDLEDVWLDRVEAEGPDGRRTVWFRLEMPRDWAGLRPVRSP